MIISRLHISHVNITYSHLLKGKAPPPTVCSTCKLPLTVKHILINCERFKRICPKHYQTNNLKDLFKNSKPEEILSFLNETNLFIKIQPNINITKTHTLNPKTCTINKINLTLLSLNHPHMLLNKIQTLRSTLTQSGYACYCLIYRLNSSA